MSTSASPLSLREFLSEAVFVGAEDIQIRRCVNRASDCQPGDVFIPKHSAGGDEHDRVEEAIRHGAVAVVAERLLPVSVPQCLVENTQEVYARVCQRLAGDPSDRLLTIGVVGTHGKTTTALYVSSMLKHLGGGVAYYTSLGASDSTECDRSATRPPEASELADWMRQADEAGAPAAVVELTPSMLANHATDGMEFDLLILTGLRPSQAPAAASGREMHGLLEQAAANLKSHGMVLVNADDAHAATWAERCEFACITYGLDAAEHVRAKRLSRQGAEQQLLVMAGNLLMPLTLKVPGEHVARAALAAVATSWMFDFSVPNAIAGVEKLQSVPGRMQRVSQAVDVPIFIDAGNTPDRVAVATHALRQHQLGPVTVVMDLDCRLDSRWRQQLGRVLDKGSNRIVLTGADLSAEAVQTLAMDVLGGVQAAGRVQVIPDRAAAILWAVDQAEQGCILLAGSGERRWLCREGQPCTDESVAKAAVTERNRKPAETPALAVFPPSEPNSFFPIDT